MTPSRPYLIRALYQWIVDNGLTPHLVVDCTRPGVEVPERYVQDGRIVLNVAPRAVQGLVLGNDEIRFQARFAGAPYAVAAPVAAVMAIYARENGRGMMFTDDDLAAEEADTPAAKDEAGDAHGARPQGGGGRPHLRVIK
ncbi:ClpXP protease specificity-enhancing factor [Inmirania thermothiophila]|uniref:Stringent starvation protein B n=1 Tax=Inmirania thermothiophila TaxID=1750597 RepID=A0A3N1XXL8_9GAMM|nr:ClpXP protease specificity-enhancing factor [Inmirania thermothiophila]ROR29667.1 stringent starvation protein B [Inmirania thermothiophila]